MKSWLWLGVAASAGLAMEGQAQPGAGVRWSAYGSDNDGEYYYDPQSVERSGGMIRYRMRALVRPGRSGATRFALLQVELNCSEQTTSVLAAETFDADGRLLDSFTRAEAIPRSERIFPDAPEVVLYRRLCPRALLRPIPAPPRLITVAPVAPPPVPARPVPPPPPLVRIAPSDRDVVRARWRTPPTALITADDYPAAALRAEMQGSVDVVLDISADGRAVGCTVTASSGSSLLDSTTCSLLVRRARFEPARDDRGNAIPDRVRTGVIWALPPEPEPAPPGEAVPAQPEQS